MCGAAATGSDGHLITSVDSHKMPTYPCRWLQIQPPGTLMQQLQHTLRPTSQPGMLRKLQPVRPACVRQYLMWHCSFVLPCAAVVSRTMTETHHQHDEAQCSHGAEQSWLILMQARCRCTPCQQAVAGCSWWPKPGPPSQP